MKTSLLKYFTLLFISVILLVGCGIKRKSSGVVDHGTIVFHIEYPEEFTSSPVGNMMPDKWLFSFNKNMIKHELKASFNVFSLSFVSNSPMDSCDVIFSFMDKHMYYPIAINDHFFLYDNDAKVVVTYEPDVTKNIAGFKCTKANIKFEGHESFDVFYTDEIKVLAPNRHTPLIVIPGVLMEFTVEYDGLKLKLTASEFLDEKPPLRDFKVPGKAVLSNRDEVVAMVNTIINTFQ